MALRTTPMTLRYRSDPSLRSLGSPLNAWLCDAPAVAAKSLPTEPSPPENRQHGEPMNPRLFGFSRLEPTI
jgi:hypothetical protein